MAIATEYARGLFLLTEEEGSSDLVLEQIKACADILAQNPKYITLTDTPALSRTERLSLVSQAFSCITPCLQNLLMILCEHHMMHQFFAVSKEYTEVYNEARGIIPATVISAAALSESQLAALKSKLEAITKKTVTLENTIDTSLIGGLILRYDGIQLDSTHKARLKSLESELKRTVL